MCVLLTKTIANTNRLTFAKTNANVALESYVVTGREFEGIERRDKHLILVLIPLAEDGWIGSATIFVRHWVGVVVISHCVTATCKSTVDSYRNKIEFMLPLNFKLLKNS